MARYVVSCLLFALSCSSIAGAAGLVGQVVCFGADGHVAVELSQGADCLQFVGKRPTSVPLVGLEMKALTHCGACLDVGLHGAQATKTTEFYDRAWLANLPAPSDLIALPPILVEVDVEPSPPHPPVHTFPPFSTLRERRTIVIQV